MATKKVINQVLILYGPTGVGKSALADHLATLIPSEIVNMDMGQCYTPLTVGTAKPDWRNAPVPHHLFDVLDEPCNYSVTQYRADLLPIVQGIWERGNLPILVGGSGFYLKSLFFPPQAQADDTPSVNNDRFVEPTWQALHAIDPVRASAIGKNDTYRIERALAIWRATGKPPSQFQQTFSPLCDATIILVTRDRQELYKRIDERVGIMLRDGWVEEVQRLKGSSWEQFLLTKKLIGYNELLGCEYSPSPELTALIAQRTRHYAKRQLTFWNMVKRQLRAVSDASCALDLQELNLTSCNLDLYISELLKRLPTA